MTVDGWANVARGALAAMTAGFLALWALGVRSTARKARALVKRGRHEDIDGGGAVGSGGNRRRTARNTGAPGVRG